jgi:uncharacterized protein
VRNPRERREMETGARALDIAFSGLWLTADHDTLVERLAARRNDASDATLATLAKQLASDIGELSPGWTYLEASGSAEATLQRALATLPAGSVSGAVA